MKKRYPGQCIHVWVLAAPGAEYQEVCSGCGATCSRGEGGVIELYDANVPPPEDRPRREKKNTNKKEDAR